MALLSDCDDASVAGLCAFILARFGEAVKHVFNVSARGAKQPSVSAPLEIVDNELLVYLVY